MLEANNCVGSCFYALFQETLMNKILIFTGTVSSVGVSILGARPKTPSDKKEEEKGTSPRLSNVQSKR